MRCSVVVVITKYFHSLFSMHTPRSGCTVMRSRGRNLGNNSASRFSGLDRPFVNFYKYTVDVVVVVVVVNARSSSNGSSLVLTIEER